MSRWMLAVVAAVVAGCAATKKEPPPKPFTTTKWQMQLELPLAGEQPYVRFGDGRMEGFGGCNRIESRYIEDTVGAKAIVIGRIQTGTKVCDSAGQNAERRLLEVIQAASSYSITLDTLSMTGSAGTIKFRSDPPYEKPK